MDFSEYQEIVTKGSYYFPASKHYTGESISGVYCDRCNRDNIPACIGYRRNDLCLECVSDIIRVNGSKFVNPIRPKPSFPSPFPTQLPPPSHSRVGDSPVRMMSDASPPARYAAVTRTKMRQSQFREPKHALTRMLQRQFREPLDEEDPSVMTHMVQSQFMTEMKQSQFRTNMKHSQFNVDKPEK